MSEPNECPDCGAELPRGTTEGLCPKCLMGAALEQSDESVEAENGSPYAATTPQSGGFIPPDPEEIAPHFPQLEILELLGHGGMGAVYKARQTKLDRLVALKIIRPESADDPTFAERFMREARTLARLNHPNIVSVHDFGEADGLYYFVMEYVDGLNLRQMLQAGEMQPEDALSVVPQICEALQFAHDDGIVHRDIKPENILVDTRGNVKIADFGLARLVSTSPQDFTLTATHQVMGTPRYMSPEQMAGSHHVDHRADIYSLGVVFYEMLTGELPMGNFEPPSRKVTLDDRLDRVVLRTLAPEPEHRYQRAGDVKTDMESITSMNSLIAQSESSPDPYPRGPSTILEQGIRQFVHGARQGAIQKILGHSATPGILAMLLSAGGVATLFVPWATVFDGEGAYHKWIHGYETISGGLTGVVFFALTIVLLAGGTSRTIPPWRSGIIIGAGAVVLLLLFGFNYFAQLGGIALMLEGGFLTAFGLCISLMLVGAWDIRQFLSQRHRGLDKEVRSKKLEKNTKHKLPSDPPLTSLRFAISAEQEIGPHILFHFAGLGYQQVEEQPGVWVFQRGSIMGGLKGKDIREFPTTLTIRTAPGNDRELLVSCLWAVKTMGSWVGNRDIKKLEAEGSDLKKLLGGDDDREWDSEQNEEPRFSRKAIIGACWAPLIIGVPLAFAPIGGPQAQWPLPWQWPLMFTIGPLGAMAPFASTILGFLALSDIRYSKGKLTGLGMALAVALGYPLLIINLAILGVLFFFFHSGLHMNIAMSLFLALVQTVIFGGWLSSYSLKRVRRIVSPLPGDQQNKARAPEEKILSKDKPAALSGTTSPALKVRTPSDGRSWHVIILMTSVAAAGMTFSPWSSSSSGGATFESFIGGKHYLNFEYDLGFTLTASKAPLSCWHSALKFGDPRKNKTFLEIPNATLFFVSLLIAGFALLRGKRIMRSAAFSFSVFILATIGLLQSGMVVCVTFQAVESLLLIPLLIFVAYCIIIVSILVNGFIGIWQRVMRLKKH